MINLPTSSATSSVWNILWSWKYSWSSRFQIWELLKYSTMHCLKVLSCVPCVQGPAPSWVRGTCKTAIAKGVVLSPVVSSLAFSGAMLCLQVLERKLKECVPWEAIWHEQLMAEIKQPQKLRSSAARENGSRPKGTCYKVTSQAFKWSQHWLKIMGGFWNESPLFRSMYNAREVGIQILCW